MGYKIPIFIARFGSACDVVDKDNDAEADDTDGDDAEVAEGLLEFVELLKLELLPLLL